MNRFSVCFLAFVLPLVLAGNDDPATCGTIFTIAGCVAVTDAPSFVDCNQTIKKCYCLPTFDGNASPNSRCRCPSPKSVFFPSILSSVGFFSGGLWTPSSWNFADPICVDLASLQALQADQAKQAKHRAAVIQFFNNTIYPTPFVILQTGGAGLNTILAPNVKSRISPAGSFDGFAGVMEYFYGFVANPGTLILSVDYVSLAATGNTVAAKVNLFLRNDNYVNTNGHPPQFFNLSIFGFFTFNSQDLIQSIDVSVPNLGILLTPTDVATQNGIMIVTCQVLTQPHPLNNNQPRGACGALGTFTGGTNTTAQFENCMDVMRSKPYGTFDRVNADNFVCRQLHMLLARYDANLHCPHTSAGGGGACINFSYESYFQTTY